VDVCGIWVARGRGVVGLFGSWDVLVVSCISEGLGKRHTLGTTPTALTNIKTTAYSPTIRLSALRINKTVLRLDNGRLALVIYTKHFAPNLELAAFARHRKWLEEFDLAFAVQDVLGVKLGDAFDGLSIAPRIEIDDFLVCVLEWENDGVGWEGREGWVEFLEDVLEVLGNLSHCAFPGAWDSGSFSGCTYVEEVQLIGIGCANAVCEEQEIALEP
jgi:hypothetical protein